jgi:CBS domain containing-hemolysin-like protein
LSARAALRTVRFHRVTSSNLASGPLSAATPHLDPWLGLALAFLLVVVNGFFVAAEFALVKVRPTQIEPHVARGELRGRLADHMVRQLDAYLSATQLGITLASLALGWIGEPAFAWLLAPVIRMLHVGPSVAHSISLTTAFITITVLHIVLGELTPKSLAIRKPEATSLWVAIPLYGFYKLTYPVIWLLNHAANGLLRLIGIRPVSEQEVAHGEEELRLLLASRRTAKLSRMKRELLDNIFELSHRNARQIMVPRADVVYLSLSRSLADNLEIARKSGHTRFPVCKDQLDDIVGLIHIKDLFRSDQPVSSLQEITREIPFVPETLAVDRLLRRMLQRKRHMAAVVDELSGRSRTSLTGNGPSSSGTASTASWSRAACWSKTSRTS